MSCLNFLKHRPNESRPTLIYSFFFCIHSVATKNKQIPMSQQIFTLGHYHCRLLKKAFMPFFFG